MDQVQLKSSVVLVLRELREVGKEATNGHAYSASPCITALRAAKLQAIPVIANNKQIIITN